MSSWDPWPFLTQLINEFICYSCLRTCQSTSLPEPPESFARLPVILSTSTAHRYFLSGALLLTLAVLAVKLFYALQTHRTCTLSLFSFYPGESPCFSFWGNLFLFMFLANMLSLYKNPLLLTSSMDRRSCRAQALEDNRKINACFSPFFMFIFNKKHNLVAYMN